jgi:hypothetical protein
MDCGSVDLKAFSLGEATASEKQVVELHVKSCGACREELSRLELTFASLGALRDEEIPKRIAFVSDKVFEPTWWQKLWNSGPQLGFASAGVLAAALIFHATYQRPSSLTTTAQVPTIQQQSSVPAMTEEQIQKRIDDAVVRAVAAVEERQKKQTSDLLMASEKKQEMDRQALLLAFEDQNAVMQKRMNSFIKQTAGLN